MTSSSGIKSFEKLAFRAALQNAARRFAPGLGPALARLRPGLSNWGQRAEEAVSRGVGHAVGPEAQALSSKLLKGTVGEMASQGIGGAVSMPLLGGGLEAAFAPEGQRWDAFTSNMGQHALTGAKWGLLSGAVGQPFRNLRRGSLSQAVKRRGLGPDAANASMDQGFRKNLKTMFTGKGIHPTAGANRELAALGAAGQVGQVGTEWIIPEKIMGEQAQPPAPPPQPLQPGQRPYAKQAAESSSSLSPGLLGAATGGVSTGLLMDALNTRGYLPAGGKGKVMNRLIPALGSVGGAYTAMQLAKPPRPKPDPIQKSLNRVDFDKLLRYYKKRED